MNLQGFYQKVRETEAAIGEEFPLIVSHGTSDGGKAGTFTEVPRRLAAMLVV